MNPSLFSIIVSVLIILFGVFLVILFAVLTKFSPVGVVLSFIIFGLGGIVISIISCIKIDNAIRSNYSEKVCTETQVIQNIDIADNDKCYIDYINDEKKLVRIKSYNTNIYYDMPENAKDCFNRIEYKNGWFSWEGIDVHLREVK